mgnify:CR=1 FL=1
MMLPEITGLSVGVVALGIFVVVLFGYLEYRRRR